MGSCLAAVGFLLFDAACDSLERKAQGRFVVWLKGIKSNFDMRENMYDLVFRGD